MVGGRTGRDTNKMIVRAADEAGDRHRNHGDHGDTDNAHPHVPHALSNRLPCRSSRLLNVLRLLRGCRRRADNPPVRKDSTIRRRGTAPRSRRALRRLRRRSRPVDTQGQMAQEGENQTDPSNGHQADIFRDDSARAHDSVESSIGYGVKEQQDRDNNRSADRAPNNAASRQPGGTLHPSHNRENDENQRKQVEIVP